MIFQNPYIHLQNALGRASLNPTRAISLSFAGIIFSGALLLMLPWASSGGHLSFIDALFTATSATCVTGLSVMDIGTRLTLFGQLVVLVLIQTGGLGIMTFSTFFLYVLGRKISLRDREAMDMTLRTMTVPNIIQIIPRIFLLVITIEGSGALLLTLLWMDQFPLHLAFYHGIFNAISAFCNAGFSLFSDNLISFNSNPWILAVVMGLIIAGGLGFVVVIDIKRFFFKREKHYLLSFHTKIVLLMTGLLIAGGAILLFLIERHQVFGSMTGSRAWLNAAFQSVTARTAGFNSVDIGAMTQAGCLVLIFLMFVGGAPASCAGGVKVTTLGIILILFISKLRGYHDARLFNRSIPGDLMNKALILIVSALFLITAVTFGILLGEAGNAATGASPNAFLRLIFESTSAYGTVGLSMGVTPFFSAWGKALIIVLMYLGRIGPLTIALALSRREEAGRFRFARGEVMVG
jgi:trk system potassium uptake protein TrkH